MIRVHVHINAESDVDRHDAIELDVSIIFQAENPFLDKRTANPLGGKKVKLISSLHTRIE
jgi:hypothetical protein